MSFISKKSLSRRHMMSVAAAGAAVSVLSPVAALQAQPAPASPPPSSAKQAAAFYRYKVGDIDVTAIHEGYAERPLEGFITNAALPDVQKTLHDAFLPQDKLRIPFTTVVINHSGKLTLIDTGIGDMGPPTTGQWMSNFTAAGFSPENVETVIISHFHGDHINGLRRKDGSDVFPKAKVLVPQAEWDFWDNEDKEKAAPEAMKAAFANVKRVFDPLKERLSFYRGGQELISGVTAVEAFGHTPGHMTFAIASGTARLMLMSDTTNHPALFVKNPDWSAIFDMDADAARATRRKLLDRIAQDRMQVAFYHAPFPATGFIARDGNGYDFIPVAWSSTL